MRLTPYLAAFLLALAGPPTSHAQAPQPPNIVVIVADDLGYADVGYRSPELHTPNIDRLSREGVRLERFYSTPICSPTRAGLMTGRYPDRYGMRRGVIAPFIKHGLPPEEVTLAEVLAEAGYERRVAFGKWHLGHSTVRYHPLNQGFTRFYGHYNGAIDYFTHKRDGELDWHRGFDSSYEEGYSTDLLSDEAVEFIEDSAGEGPFFLYLAFNAVHSPMQAKPQHLAQQGYDPALGQFQESTGGQQRNERDTANYGRIGNGNTIRQTYLGMLSGLDEGVGRVLGALDAEGIADNTLVFFLSDNGGARGQARQLGGAGIAQCREARAADNLRLWQQGAHHRLQTLGAQDHRFLAAAGVEHPVGEDVAAFGIGAKLGLVQGDERDVPLHRHGLRGAEQPARILRQDLLLAGDEGDLALALEPDDPVIDFAREQPQREADHPARMRAQPLDRQMRLSGIGRPQYGRQRRPGEIAHPL